MSEQGATELVRPVGVMRPGAVAPMAQRRSPASVASSPQQSALSEAVSMGMKKVSDAMRSETCRLIKS